MCRGSAPSFPSRFFDRFAMKPWLIAVALLTTLSSVALAQPPGDEPETPTTEAELDAAVGSAIDIALASGDLLTDAKLTGIERNKKTSEIAALRVQRPGGGKAAKLPRKSFLQVA